MTVQIVKTRIDCEHGTETLIAYQAPIFRGDWVYWIACDECGRMRKWTHRQKESNRLKEQAIIAEAKEQALETLNTFGKDDT